MNRRELLKSSATLAAAVVGCIPQETKPVVNLTTRLSDECIVEVAVTDTDGWIVIDEIWRQHRLAEHLPDPKVVPGWSHFRVPAGT